MSPTADKKGLLMTSEKGVYSFHCDTPNQCYWTMEEYELKIKRNYHLMMSVPSSLVENCDCELDSAGDCRCKPGVIGPDCDQRGQMKMTNT